MTRGQDSYRTQGGEQTFASRSGTGAGLGSSRWHQRDYQLLHYHTRTRQSARSQVTWITQQPTYQPAMETVTVTGVGKVSSVLWMLHGHGHGRRIFILPSSNKRKWTTNPNTVWLSIPAWPWQRALVWQWCQRPGDPLTTPGVVKPRPQSRSWSQSQYVYFLTIKTEKRNFQEESLLSKRRREKKSTENKHRKKHAATWFHCWQVAAAIECMNLGSTIAAVTVASTITHN